MSDPKKAKRSAIQGELVPASPNLKYRRDHVAWGEKYTRRLYEDPGIVATIIAHKKLGLKDAPAFLAAGLDAFTATRWRGMLSKPDCPPALIYLFKEMNRSEGELHGKVMDVVVQAALDGDWRAGLGLLTTRWKDKDSKDDIKMVESSGPNINMERLSDEQRQQYKEILKVGVIEEPADATVKLIIKLPDNGRS